MFTLTHRPFSFFPIGNFPLFILRFSPSSISFTLSQCPQVCDLLSFAHGPFQQLLLAPKPVVLLQTDAPADGGLVAAARGMLRAVGLHAFTVHVAHPPALAAVALEALFDRAVLALMRELKVDQVAWPGKGRDEALYGISRPTS